MDPSAKSRRLRELILAPETLVMPDAFDPLSARIIEKLGFPAVQCSGFSMALAAMRPAEADFGLEANLALTRAIAAAVQVPVMADAEDGFGDADAVGGTVRAYVAAGLAGMNLEDQVLGQPGPKRVVGREEMSVKIRVARAAAREAGNADLVINGRTDALMVGTDRQAGLREAAERANAYLAAGADLAFVVGVATMDEVTFLRRELHGPLSIAAGMPYNLQTLPLAALKAAGVARVSLPVVAVFAAVRAMSAALQSIRDTGDVADLMAHNRLCGMEDVAALLAGS